MSAAAEARTPILRTTGHQPATMTIWIRLEREEGKLLAEQARQNGMLLDDYVRELVRHGSGV